MAKTRDLRGDDVTASVRTRDGRSHMARVLWTELSETSFHVDLAFLSGLPTLADKDAVTIAFAGQRLVGRPTAKSTYVASAATREAGRGRFHVDVSARGGLSALTERRVADRVAMATAPVAAVRLSGSKVGTVWNAVLRDLSSNGLQLGFPAATDPALQPGQNVDLQFTLQGDDEPFVLRAELQYRRPGRGRVSYGVEFLRVPAEAFQSLQGRLFGVLIGLACDRAN